MAPSSVEELVYCTSTATSCVARGALTTFLTERPFFGLVVRGAPHSTEEPENISVGTVPPCSDYLVGGQREEVIRAACAVCTSQPQTRVYVCIVLLCILCRKQSCKQPVVYVLEVVDGLCLHWLRFSAGFSPFHDYIQVCHTPPDKRHVVEMDARLVCFG